MQDCRPHAIVSGHSLLSRPPGVPCPGHICTHVRACPVFSQCPSHVERGFWGLAPFSRGITLILLKLHRSTKLRGLSSRLWQAIESTFSIHSFSLVLLYQ